jgi:hypothetical protein
MAELESVRELNRVNHSLGAGGVDHRDPDAHSAAVRDRGSSALKEVRRTAGPDRSGTVRVLLDKLK